MIKFSKLIITSLLILITTQTALAALSNEQKQLRSKVYSEKNQIVKLKMPRSMKKVPLEFVKRAIREIEANKIGKAKVTLNIIKNKRALAVHDSLIHRHNKARKKAVQLHSNKKIGTAKFNSIIADLRKVSGKISSGNKSSADKNLIKIEKSVYKFNKITPKVKSSSSRSTSKISFNKIPTYFSSENTGEIIYGVEGYIIDFNPKDVNVSASVNNQDKELYCEYYYKQNEYDPSRPNAPVNNLAAMLPIPKHLQRYLEQEEITPTRNFKNVVAVNANFFNVKKLSLYSTIGKPIYEETCNYNIGDLYSSGFGQKDSTGQTLSSNYYPSEFDKPLMSVAFTNTADVYAIYDPAIYLDTSKAIITGGAIRVDGDESVKSKLPKIMADKMNSKVGRTVIGINDKSNNVRIVVIQPGNPENPARGASVDELLSHFFKRGDYSSDSKTFDTVVLLDGGGSSQLAANFNSETYVASDSSEPRKGSDCIDKGFKFRDGLIEECTLRGNLINGDDFGLYDTNNHEWRFDRAIEKGFDKFLLDRPVPNLLTIRDK